MPYLEFHDSHVLLVLASSEGHSTVLRGSGTLENSFSRQLVPRLLVTLLWSFIGVHPPFVKAGISVRKRRNPIAAGSWQT